MDDVEVYLNVVLFIGALFVYYYVRDKIWS